MHVEGRRCALRRGLGRTSPVADRRPPFSDIVEGAGWSPLSARSASFFCYQVMHRHRSEGPKASRGRREPALRRPAGFGTSTLLTHSTLLTSAESCVAGLAGATGAIKALAPAARTTHRAIMAKLPMIYYKHKA